MRTSNLANESIRQSETGHVFEEQLTNTQGTLQLDRYTTFRVRATGATTVTIGGILAMTMVSGEIAMFCTGFGDPTVGASPGSGATNQTVPVIIGGANAFVQVARNNKRQI